MGPTKPEIYIRCANVEKVNLKWEDENKRYGTSM
jgi:hypothetical protein